MEWVDPSKQVSGDTYPGTAGIPPADCRDAGETPAVPGKAVACQALHHGVCSAVTRLSSGIGNPRTQTAPGRIAPTRPPTELASPHGDHRRRQTSARIRVRERSE